MKSKYTWFLLLGVIFVLLIAPGHQSVNAQVGCQAWSLTISPDSDSYSQGTSLELYGASNCNNVRFTVDGVAFAGINASTLRETLQTNTIMPGSHPICFEALGSGNWNSADLICQRILIRSRINLVGTTHYSACPIDPGRVAIGDVITVSDLDPSPLPLRLLPGTSQQQLALIPVQTELTILNGPICAENWRWWKVFYDGYIAWVGEIGPQRLYNLVPPYCPVHFVELDMGDWAQVTPGTPNRIRSEAGLGYPQIGTAQPWVTFRLVDGPVCRNNIWWWKIRYGNVTGWTAEGDDMINWLMQFP